MTDEELVRALSKGIADVDQQQETADRIEALERERNKWRDCFNTNTDILWATEERLAKAVEALRFYAKRGVVSPQMDDQISEDGGDKARTTLAEIEGEKG